MKGTLPKRIQCKACPWRKDVVPERDIPGGYCAKKHANLRGTVNQGLRSLVGGTPAMACHESPPGKEIPCIGWLDYELGPGNNIGLRIRAMHGQLPQYEVVGEQHETFEDTLPKSKGRRRYKRRTPGGVG